MPLEDTDIVLLDWWKNHEYRFPQSSLRWPSSSQYLAAPASTAGVERVFSAAGRTCTTIYAQVDEGLGPGALSLRPLQHRLFEHSLLRLRIASG